MSKLINEGFGYSKITSDSPACARARRIFLSSQLIISTSKKVALSANKEGVFLSNKTFRQPGAGRPQKYPDLEDFIVKSVKQIWESGASISPEQLHYLVMKHALTNKDAYNKL
jgi:hypothetical protein